MRDIVIPPSTTDKIKPNGQKELIADGVRRKPPISVQQALNDAIPPPPTVAPPPLVDSQKSSAEISNVSSYNFNRRTELEISPESLGKLPRNSGNNNDACGSSTRPHSIVSSLEGGMVAIDDDIDDDITTTGSDSYGHDDDSSTNNEGNKL